MGVDMRPAVDSRNAILRLEEEKEVAPTVRPLLPESLIINPFIPHPTGT